jgi:hypothetical protein
MGDIQYTQCRRQSFESEGVPCGIRIGKSHEGNTVHTEEGVLLETSLTLPKLAWFMSFQLACIMVACSTLDHVIACVLYLSSS